jgi:4'-phosphopantetheinyl transferase
MLTRVAPLDPGQSPISDAVHYSYSGELYGETVNLWVLRVAGVDLVRLDQSVLDPRESEYAATLETPGHRLRYTLGHVALRQFLGQYLDLPPERIAYVREPCPHCGAPHGRTAVHQPPRKVHLSLSMSGDVVLIGIASAPLGVDVEVLPRPQTISEVSQLLHPAERAEIRAAAPSQQAMAFTRLWVRKEAYLKGVGVGVVHGLATEYLGTDKEAAAPRGWTVLSVPVPPSYDAALAIQTGPAPTD